MKFGQWTNVRGTKNNTIMTFCYAVISILFYIYFIKIVNANQLLIIVRSLMYIRLQYENITNIIKYVGKNYKIIWYK